MLRCYIILMSLCYASMIMLHNYITLSYTNVIVTLCSYNLPHYANVILLCYTNVIKVH